MDLTGKLAVVTGGSGDIGRAICEALAAAGADVTVTYVGDLERANTSADLVRAAGRAADVLQLDQRDEASIDAAAAAVADRGRCDVLVNNAAWNIGIPFRNLETLDSATWDRVQETNLRGPYLLTRALAEMLQADGGGRVVNIASVGGLLPGSSSIAYSCSKAALIHLTHCLAVAMSPTVTVNCVAPGLVEGTRMAARLPDEISEGARRASLLGQVGSPIDIASATVMLCQAESITGQTMVVDGGNPAAMNFG
ncbi:MAG: SDR family oxidoreductase [Acidimicrobiales bacterium]|nr:SDR family oxidoreductase [Acidimicrobiales bacterium]MXX43430.1 SDR family oxidoreductase [Acidimicrobiales bacterium]MXZ15472.1 SDR family oxidoreductase [Acidimicrobiales bacterium]MYB82400.1 SDR family oxidoreductase [Acidimicrobiales bacterium]MYD34199.1 SDR family oxidoreductase [Acidimicrobiales bacterium]